MALLFSLTNDLTPAPDYSEYDSSPSTTNIYIDASAGMNGTNYGLVVTNGASLGNLTSTLGSPIPISGGDTFRIGLYFDKNTYAITSGGSIEFTQVVNSGSTTIGAIGVEDVSGTLKLRFASPGASKYLYYSLGGVSGDLTVEGCTIVESSLGAGDGEAHLYINGVLIDSDTGINNYTTMTANGIDRVVIYDAGSSSLHSGSLYIDQIQLRNDDTPIYPVSTNEKILSLSVPLLSGSTVWTTTWKDSNLYAQKRDTTGAVTTEYDLGAATESELNAKTYVAYVFAITDSRVIVYGRMDAPQSLSSPSHIIYTTDGGSTWLEQQSGWAADNCGALLTDKTGKIYAIRNQASGSPILYTGSLGGLVMYTKATLPFSVGVNHGNLFLDGDENLFSAAGATDSITVAVCPPPYLAWANITSDHPSVAVNRIIRL